MTLVVLIGRKGRKTPLGVIESKTKNKSRLSKALRRSIKRGFTFKIITSSQLKKMLVKKVKSRILKKRVRRR